MPSNTPNIIQSLRSAHDPHFKLSGKVGGLENKLTDQVSEIHRTLSKTFVTQRKTLVRVLGLEGRVSELESQQAAEEQAKEGIEDILKDIREDKSEEEHLSPHATPEEVEEYKNSVPMTDDEKEFKKTESFFDTVDKAVSTKKRPAKPIGKKIPQKKKPKIKATKKRIKAENLKKGTVLDDAFKARVMGTDPSGQYLSPEERKRRFKFGDTQPEGALSTETLQPSSDTEQIEQADGAKKSIGASPVSDVLTNSLKAIASSLDNIKGILGDQSKTQQDAQEDARVAGEQDKAKKKESALEKVMGPVKKVGEKLLKPFKSILESAIEFLSKIFFGRVAIQLFDWFTNPENTSKVTSIFKFIKDFWPAIVAALVAFLPGLLGPVGVIAGITALLLWGVPKIVNAVKAIFGFGPKVDDAIKNESKELNKDMKNAEKGVNDKLKPEDDVDQATTETNVDTPDAELSEVQNNNQEVSKEIDKESIPAMAKGGPVMSQDGGKVEGQKGVDKVPAMLTEGEFVMSKGAVQEYGLETLANMNAAAGGTNKPSMMSSNKSSKITNIKNSKNYYGGGSVGGDRRSYFGGGSVSNNRMSYFGGGFVGDMKNNIGNFVSNVKSQTSSVTKFVHHHQKGGKNSAQIAASESNSRKINPPSTPSLAQTIKQNAQRNSATYSGSDMPAKGIPNFDADLMRSQSKIRVLGLSV